MRESGRTRIDLCIFRFHSAANSQKRERCGLACPKSFGSAWNKILKRAKIKHREVYESRHIYACWALSAGAKTNFTASRMGHNSLQMVYSVYGIWMNDNNVDQMSILNANLEERPLMPRSVNNLQKILLNQYLTAPSPAY